MVANSADDAVANARQTTSNDVGMCLYYTQEWLETPHAYPDATTQWEQAKHRHKGDKNPPKGAPVFWTGGSHGYGHACISVGGGRIRTIDQQYSGVTSEVPLDEISRDWGLPYGGWAEDCGGVDIPWLRAETPPPPEPEGILGMTTQIWGHASDDQKLQADGDWHDLIINDDGDYTVVKGKTDQIVATANVLLAGLAEGESFDLCWREAKFKDGQATQYTSTRGPRGPSVNRGNIEASYAGKLNSYDGGWSARLRLSYRTQSKTASVRSVVVEGWHS